METAVEGSLATIQRRIGAAAKAAGRDPSSVSSLTAVSKQQPWSGS